MRQLFALCFCVWAFLDEKTEDESVSQVPISDAQEEVDSYTKRLVIHSYMLNYKPLGADTDKSPHNDWDSYLIIICNL